MSHKVVCIGPKIEQKGTYHICARRGNYLDVGGGVMITVECSHGTIGLIPEPTLFSIDPGPLK